MIKQKIKRILEIKKKYEWKKIQRMVSNKQKGRITKNHLSHTYDKMNYVGCEI